MILAIELLERRTKQPKSLSQVFCLDAQKFLCIRILNTVPLNLADNQIHYHVKIGTCMFADSRSAVPVYPASESRCDLIKADAKCGSIAGNFGGNESR